MVGGRGIGYMILAALLLCISGLWAMGRLVNPVGPKVEFTTAGNNVKLVPKRLNRVQRVNVAPVAPDKAPWDKGARHREETFLSSTRPYSSTSEKQTSTRIIRQRERETALRKKMEATLLYKPKFPASRQFQMCRLADFDVSMDSKLGRGGFGSVFLGQHRATGVPVAIKFISNVSIRKSPKHVEHEETIHGRLVHPGIVRFGCTMIDPKTSDIFFVMEYIPGLTLSKRIGRDKAIAHALIQKWVAQITLALNYMHDEWIVYRDMKAENIIINDEDDAKVLDFGLTVRDDGSLKNVAGTLEYTAPEMAARRLHGREVDFYGLGILVYTLKMGRLPFRFRESKLDKKGYLRKVANEFRIPLTNDPVYDDLLARLCDRNPATRWGVSPETRSLLRKHPFFSGLDWAALEAKALEARPDSPITGPAGFRLSNPVPLTEFIESGELLEQSQKKK